MYRPEHPKPQFFRDKWFTLNGDWDFAFDFGKTGIEKGWPGDPSDMDMTICVPFCPESKLSGIEYTDIIPAVWYHRTFTIPDAWKKDRIFIHFGAVDYDCRVWINGIEAGRHYGGGASFAFEITHSLKDGENSVVVYAVDDVRSGTQPVGKQSRELRSHDCDYTRTTGIWQSVWIEARPASFLKSVKITPDFDNSRFNLNPVISCYHRDMQFRATLMMGNNKISEVCAPASNGMGLSLDIPDAHPWSPSDPFLYDIKFELLDGDGVVDTVYSYAGLRKFHIEGHKFYLNNKPIFLRFVLDQGFNPDGIWTAPSDEELRADIERSLAVGFSGARLHQKVFEERFHYWADKLGYMTWGEYYDWGMDFNQPQAIHNHQREWREVVMRDMNHPSILAWTPFNETSYGYSANPQAHTRALQETYALTKDLDPTRPINDASGWVHVQTDIYTMHNYEQNPEIFAKTYSDLTPESNRGFCVVIPQFDQGYRGQPFVIDEYGGTWWENRPEDDTAGNERHQSWGYGQRPECIEEVYARIEGLTAAILNHPNIAGFCYTQITDVEQERNGIYTYDRKPKFDCERLKKALQAPAAIENLE